MEGQSDSHDAEGGVCSWTVHLRFPPFGTRTKRIELMAPEREVACNLVEILNLSL